MALILLLLFALAGFLLNQMGLFSPSGNPTSGSTTSSAPPTSPTPTRTTPSATPTQTQNTPTPTPTPTPTQETVNVIPAAYLGKDYRQVQASLAGLGLQVTVLPQESTSAAPGTVLELNPTGTVPQGTLITVIYATAPSPAPTTAAPKPTPTTSSPVAGPTPISPLPTCAAGQTAGTPPTCTP